MATNNNESQPTATPQQPMAVAILGFITLALSSAPQVAGLVQQLKDLISSFAAAGKITKEQQAALHAHIDSVKALVDAGIVPSHWLVAPDPVLP